MIQLPEDFTGKMRRLLGDEADAFFQSYERPAAQALRVNTLKVTAEELQRLVPFSLRPVPWTETGFYYDAADRPGRHPYHEAGLYYIQEPSAMAVGELAAARPGERVLDLCAAPGGKTTHLAASMQGEGLLVSNEIHPARARILSQNVERMGIRNAVVTNGTPKELAEHFPEFFDRIVVDAPCSGEGMFRKDPDACGEWSLDNVAMCARRQAQILDEAASMLQPGGTLIYSTCTFAPEEDEGSVGAFLERHPEFSVKKVPAYEGFSGGRPIWADTDARTADTFRLWPHRLAGEGHYIAILGKTEEGRGDRKRAILEGIPEGWEEKRGAKGRMKKSRMEKGRSEKGRSEKRRDGQALQAAMKLYGQFAAEYLVEAPEGEPVLFGDQLYLLPCALKLDGLKILRAGLHVGTCRKNRLEPAHALAMALGREQAKQCCMLSAADYRNGNSMAEAYLRGEALSPAGADGWNLVLADGYSLGWGKQSAGILKNHYPKGLRRP